MKFLITITNTDGTKVEETFDGSPIMTTDFEIPIHLIQNTYRNILDRLMIAMLSPQSLRINLSLIAGEEESKTVILFIRSPVGVWLVRPEFNPF